MTTWVVSDSGGWVALGSSNLPASGVTPGTYGDSTHVGQFTVNTAGQVTAASNVAISGGGGGGGGEIGYDQITAAVTITSTTESSGTTVITSGTYTFDGNPVIAEFFTPELVPPVGAGVIVCMFEGTTEIGRIAAFNGVASSQPAGGVTARYRFSPSAGSHQYKITAFKTATGTGTSSVQAGATGTGVFVPAYLRFTQV